MAGDVACAYVSEDKIIDCLTQYYGLQVPVGAYGTDKELADEQHWSQTVNMLIYGQDGGHDYVAALHDEVGDYQEKQVSGKLPDRLEYVHEITRYYEEARHVERIDHGVRIGVFGAEPGQMETDHQYYEQALEHVKLRDTLFLH